MKFEINKQHYNTDEMTKFQRLAAKGMITYKLKTAEAEMEKATKVLDVDKMTKLEKIIENLQNILKHL